MKDYLSFDVSSLVCNSSQMKPELRKSGFQTDFSTYSTQAESSLAFFWLSFFLKSLYSTGNIMAKEVDFNSTSFSVPCLNNLSIFTSAQQYRTPFKYHKLQLLSSHPFTPFFNFVARFSLTTVEI